MALVVNDAQASQLVESLVFAEPNQLHCYRVKPTKARRQRRCTSGFQIVLPLDAVSTPAGGVGHAAGAVADSGGAAHLAGPGGSGGAAAGHQCRLRDGGPRPGALP